MAKTEVRSKIKPDLLISEPSLFKILYFNDEVTTMEFVIESLIDYFEYPEDAASLIADKIHNEGSSVVAILPYEIAEQKGIEITRDARSRGFPLLIKIESVE